jgi:hypothetical protein
MWKEIKMIIFTIFSSLKNEIIAEDVIMAIECLKWPYFFQSLRYIYWDETLFIHLSIPQSTNATHYISNSHMVPQTSFEIYNKTAWLGVFTTITNKQYDAVSAVGGYQWFGATYCLHLQGRWWWSWYHLKNLVTYWIERRRKPNCCSPEMELVSFVCSFVCSLFNEASPVTQAWRREK